MFSIISTIIYVLSFTSLCFQPYQVIAIDHVFLFHSLIFTLSLHSHYRLSSLFLVISPVSLLLSPAPLLWSAVSSISLPCGLSGFSLYGLFFNAHESFLSSLYGYFSFILSYSPTSSFSSLVSFLYQREFKTVVLRLQCQLVLCICSNFDGCSPYTVSEYIWLSKN